MMMNMLTMLTWFTSKKDYLKPFADDESAKKAAMKLWTAIDSNDWIPFVLMVILTAIICLYYFFPFNKMPGRHYHPKWWGVFCGVSLLAIFVVSFFVCYLLAQNPGFDYGFLFKVSAMNTIYALALYAILSWVINRTGKSNAYPCI